MAFSTPDTQIAGYVVLASDWNELVNNFIAVNGFFRLDLWPGPQAYAPLSGVTAAGSETNESSGAGTLKPVIPILTLPNGADEARIWVRRWPRGYGVSAALVGSYYMTEANTDDEAVLECYIAAVSDGDTSMTEKVFDSANQLIHTVPDAIGTADEFSIPLTNADSVAADDWVCIALMRNGDDGSDTAVNGNLAFTSLAVDFSLAT